MPNALFRVNVKERGGMKDGKNKKRIKDWVNGWVDHFDGFSSICKVRQL